jgi:multiple sugar transport system substrate-binding protein
MDMDKNKLFVVLAVLIVASMILSACSSTADTTTAEPAVESAAEEANNEPVNIKFTLWGSDAHIALLTEISEEYRQTHPNVTFEFVSIPVADYVSKLAVQLAGNDQPDMGWMLESPALGWEDAGALVDLSSYLKDDADFNLSDFSESSLSLWTQGDALYGIPFSTSPMFIAYNADLFEKAGLDTPSESYAKGEWTWEKFAEDAKAITDLGDGSIGYVHIDEISTNPWRLLVPVMQAYGGGSWSSDGTTCLMSTDESIEAATLVHNMMYVDNSIVKPNEKVDFTSGTVGMTMRQLSWLSSLADVTFKWDFAPLPSGPAGSKPVVGQAAVVVFNSSPNKEIAIDFLKFLMNSENSAKLSQFFPQARASVLDAGSIEATNPNLNTESIQTAIIDQIKNGTVLPSHVEYSKIDLAVRAELDKLWTDEVDIATIMNSACEVMTPYLNQ